jgi:hypothetical protein
MRQQTCCAVGLILLFCLARATTAAEAVQVGGDAAAKPGEWTVARIQSELADQIKPIEYTTHGESHKANALPLLALLKAAGVQTELKMDPNADPKTKNAPIRLAISVQGKDGYTAAFALAELLSDVGKRDTWLALDSDDKPLRGREAPLQLIVPGDGNMARWVRGVARITITDLATPATRPAAQSP